MKPLSDFFFDTDVMDTGPDMVSFSALCYSFVDADIVLSHDVEILWVFSRNRSIFVLFTCHRRPPFLIRGLFTGWSTYVYFFITYLIPSYL